MLCFARLKVVVRHGEKIVFNWFVFGHFPKIDKFLFKKSIYVIRFCSAVAKEIYFLYAETIQRAYDINIHVLIF